MSFMTLSELMDKKFEPLLKINKNRTIEFTAMPGYEIDLDKIKTKADLLQWTHHLTGKARISNSALGDFIEEVCKYKKWDLFQIEGKE